MATFAESHPHYMADNVAYSWSCGNTDSEHVHTVDCLTLWHYCNQSLDPELVNPAWVARPAPDLLQARPLVIEQPIDWSDCCGMRGIVRDDRYLPQVFDDLPITINPSEEETNVESGTTYP